MIREFEKNNVKELDKQVKMGKYDVDKMTEFEKEYNYELLQKEMNSKKENAYIKIETMSIMIFYDIF